MLKIRAFLKSIPKEALLIFLIIVLLPIEHKYDRPLRPFFYRFTDIPRDTVKSLYFYLSDFLVIFGALFLILRKRGEALRFFFQKKSKLLLGLVLCAFASILWIPTDITYWMKATYFSCSLLGYSLCVFFFRSQSPRTFFLALFWSVLLVSAFECTVGISQYFRQKPVGLRLLSEPKLASASTKPVTILVGDGTLWLPSYILHGKGKLSQAIRAYGTFPHPNVFGGFLAFSLFCSYGLFLLFKKARALIALCLFFQIFTLIITFSRSALFAWILGSLVWALCFVHLKERRKDLLKLSSLCALFLTLCAGLFFHQIRDRGGVISYTDIAKASDQGRVEAQVDAWDVILKRPLTGVGFSNYQKGAQELFHRPCKMVHNIYLMVAAEMGLIALILFALFIVKTLMAGWMRRGDPFYSSILAAFCCFLFIGACDFYPLCFQQTRVIFFCLAAFLVLEESRFSVRKPRPVELHGAAPMQ
jgi:hypothetical protein